MPPSNAAWCGVYGGALGAAGLDVHLVPGDGVAELAAQYGGTPTVVMLDLAMPGALWICRRLASAPTMLLALQDRGSKSRLIEALECGADDARHDDTDPSEIVARVHALLRRC